MTATLADRIDAILPQTQCTKCGYPGCRPYAEAIATGEADVNQCPPGGAEGIRKLAKLLGRDFKPLNPVNGIEKPNAIAVIEEEICIGCALCIEACPVDAIVGAAKQMHTVIAEYCTGCELCVAPCPVDCISMIEIKDYLALGGVPAGGILFAESESEAQQAADASRERFNFRNFRLEREQREKEEKLAEKAASSVTDPKQAAIQAAIERAKANRARNP